MKKDDGLFGNAEKQEFFAIFSSALQKCKIKHVIEQDVFKSKIIKVIRKAIFSEGSDPHFSINDFDEKIFVTHINEQLDKLNDRDFESILISKESEKMRKLSDNYCLAAVHETVSAFAKLSPELSWLDWYISQEIKKNKNQFGYAFFSGHSVSSLTKSALTSINASDPRTRKAVYKTVKRVENVVDTPLSGPVGAIKSAALIVPNVYSSGKYTVKMHIENFKMKRAKLPILRNNLVKELKNCIQSIENDKVKLYRLYLFAYYYPSLK